MCRARQQLLLLACQFYHVFNGLIGLAKSETSEFRFRQIEQAYAPCLSVGSCIIFGRLQEIVSFYFLVI